MGSAAIDRRLVTASVLGMSSACFAAPRPFGGAKSSSETGSSPSTPAETTRAAKSEISDSDSTEDTVAASMVADTDGVARRVAPR